eukprot:867209-Prorocentrum_minimum.AAC.1
MDGWIPLLQLVAPYPAARSSPSDEMQCMDGWIPLLQVAPPYPAVRPPPVGRDAVSLAAASLQLPRSRSLQTASYHRRMRCSVMDGWMDGWMDTPAP